MNGDEPTLQQLDLQVSRQASLEESGPPLLPGYQLSRRLGEGTFGQVYAGTQVSTGQAVALKVLHRAGRDLDREVERLRQVSQHPYVVTLLDANLAHTPPFLVMPLLERSLAAAVGRAQDHPQIRLEQIVAWLEQAATALQYVHGRGLLHCDLKPANLLVDENQVVRVADFGQALLQADSEQRLGTLFYMPHEQAVVDRPVVPAASWDIYALGASFYQLLTGRLPRADTELQSELSHLTTSRQILSHYSHRLPGRPLVPIRRLNPGVDSDLAAIVEHCLESEPEQRYRDVGGLLADLQRRRGLLPLACRAATPAYVLSRFLRRNRAAVIVALVATGFLALAFQRVLEERARALHQARVARQQEAKARETSAQFAFLSAATLEGSEALLRVAQAVEQSDGPSTRLRCIALHLHQQLHPVLLARTPLNGENRGLELADDPGSGVIDLAQGRLLACQANGPRPALLNWKSGQVDWLDPVQEFDGGQCGAGQVIINDGGRVDWAGQTVEADWMRLDPSGHLLALGEADDENEPLQTLHLVGSQPAAHFRLRLKALSMRQAEFSEEGSLLAHVGQDGSTHLWQTRPPRLLWWRPLDTEQVAFLPDRRSLLLRHRFALERVDRGTGRSLQRLACQGVTAALTGGPQRFFYSTNHDRAGKLFQAGFSSEDPPQSIDCPALPQAMVWDRQRLAVGFSDGKVRMYAGDINLPEGVMQCPEGVRWLAFSGDELIAFAGSDDRPGHGSLWRWQLNPARGPQLPAAASYQLYPWGALAFTASQVTLAPYASRPVNLPVPATSCLWVDTERLVVTLPDGRVRRLRPDATVIGQLQLPAPLQALRPDGRAALVCNPDGREWREIDLETGHILRQHPRPDEVLERPVYSADGKVAMVFRAADSTCVQLFTQRPLEIRTGFPPRQLVLNPDGSRFWLITWLAPGQASTVFTGSLQGSTDPDALARMTHANMVSSIRFSRDSVTVVTASSDGSAALWPAQPAPATLVRPQLVIRTDEPLLNAQFSTDGSLVATQSIHGPVRLWDAGSGLPIGPPLPSDPSVEPCFSQSGQLVTVVQGRPRPWDLSPAPAQGAVEEARKRTGLSP